LAGRDRGARRTAVFHPNVLALTAEQRQVWPRALVSGGSPLLDQAARVAAGPVSFLPHPALINLQPCLMCRRRNLKYWVGNGPIGQQTEPAGSNPGDWRSGVRAEGLGAGCLETVRRGTRC